MSRVSLNTAEAMPGEDKAVMYRRPHEWPARKWVNNDYPRFEAWFDNDTYLGPDTDTLRPHPVSSGAHMSPITIARREWDAGAPPTRSAAAPFYLGWPYEKLAGTTITDLTGDTNVGPDWYHFPRRMFKAVYDWAQLVHRRLSAEGFPATEGYLRCLAYKHTFRVYNYNRHPVRLYYVVGENFLGASNMLSAVASTTAPLDMSRYNIAHIDIPGVLDAGDQPQFTDLVVKRNMAGQYPEVYKLEPSEPVLGTITDGVGTSWVEMKPLGTLSTTISNILQAKPPQLQDLNVDDTGFEAENSKMAHHIEFGARLLTGLNVGNTDSTIGTGGTVATNGIVLRVKSAWKMEWIAARGTVGVGENVHNALQRAKAWPAQTA